MTCRASQLVPPPPTPWINWTAFFGYLSGSIPSLFWSPKGKETSIIFALYKSLINIQIAVQQFQQSGLDDNQINGNGPKSIEKSIKLTGLSVNIRDLKLLVSKSLAHRHLGFSCPFFDAPDLARLPKQPPFCFFCSNFAVVACLLLLLLFRLTSPSPCFPAFSDKSSCSSAAVLISAGDGGVSSRLEDLD